MKKLNITKEQFNKSNYFQSKYGKLKYVSESGRLFKTNKGKILKFNESTDGISLSDIYSALKKEYDGKLFSDNFINLTVEQEGSQVVVKPELEIPDDLDLGNQDDYEWWQDKIDSTSLLYDEVVKFLVDKYGEIFQYNEIGVSDEYIDKTNFDGQFVIDNDQEDDDSPFVVTICEKQGGSRRLNEDVSYGLTNDELDRELDKELDDEPTDEPTDDIKVGDILYAVWNWEYDTVPHFYKVCQVKKSTILLQKLRSEHIGGYANTPEGAKLVPDETDTSGETSRVRIRPDGCMKEPGKYGGNPLYKWDGKPKPEIRMNESRCGRYAR